MQTEILLGAIQEGNPQPSLFELIMLENMEKLVKPSIRHILLTIASHLNQDTLYDYADSISHSINTALEFYHLYKVPMASTWIESLYGIVRIGSNDSLTPMQRGLSFAYICIIPRIISLLQSLKERYNYILTDDSKPILRFVLKALGFIGDLYSATDTILIYAFRIFYITGLSSYHHPLFALLNMRMMKRRLLLQNKEGADKPPVQNSNWTMSAIIMIIYAVKAAEFFINNDLSEFYLSSKLSPPLPLLAPPAPPKVARGGVVPPQDPSLCPLCLNKRVDPVACTSGYVFCYLCLLDYVRERGKCPVSAMPCKESDFIRIYEQ